LCSGLADLCDAISALHREGFSHRFLSPDAIVSLRGHQLVLRDLGLAVRRYEPGEGPPNYQAPEQRTRACGRVGPLTDAYQIAAVAYHLITGQLPHGTTPLPLRRLAPDVPERLGAAIDAGLAADPADRPGMRSLRSQLKAGCDDIS
jgi:serine/threonine protein kinase